MAKAKKKAAKKVGRPSKIDDEMSIRFAAYLAGEGKTDEEIGKKLGVSRVTVHNWKTQHAEFFNTLKSEKEAADKSVEKSLYERACGYSVEEELVFCYRGEIITHRAIKHYPPDPTSMIFWLKNRQPDRWRDKVDAQDEEIEEMEFEG